MNWKIAISHLHNFSVVFCSDSSNLAPRTTSILSDSHSLGFSLIVGKSPCFILLKTWKHITWQKVYAGFGIALRKLHSIRDVGFLLEPFYNLHYTQELDHLDNFLFSSAIKSKVVRNVGSVEVELPDTGVAFFSLDGPDYDSYAAIADKELIDFASSFDGSYVSDNLESLNVELIIPLSSGFKMSLHMSKLTFESGFEPE